MNKHLYIKAGFKNQKTFLEKSFYRQPFKLANITEDRNADPLRLMIMSSSPGILDNDNYLFEMDIQENAAVHITTQGYQRLYTMSNKACQCVNVRLQNNGSLYFLPHPNVPHEASNFSSLNNIYLCTNHNLVWSEIITCGRKLSGEEFKFTKFHTVTNIYVQNKLVVRENVSLEPLNKNIHSIGQLEGYTHQSTLLFLNNAADVKKLAGQCKNVLSNVPGISFGMSMLRVNGLIIRILGYTGEKLFNCNNELADYLRKSSDTLSIEEAVWHP